MPNPPDLQAIYEKLTNLVEAIAQRFPACPFGLSVHVSGATYFGHIHHQRRALLRTPEAEPVAQGISIAASGSSVLEAIDGLAATLQDLVWESRAPMPTEE